MSLIVLKDIVKQFKRGTEDLTILKSVSLSVEQGEFIAIVGPSGSGKSTLMNTIGLLDVPTSGSYVLDGVVTEKLKDDQLAEVRNKKIGFIFQQFNLLPRLTAIENVELPMIYAGFSKKERRERGMHMLETLGMGQRSHHRPSELSGGQQ
ncbi:ATP-binding cassette domain-containing protein, partial [Paenibacillus validus]